MDEIHVPKIWYYSPKRWSEALEVKFPGKAVTDTVVVRLYDEHGADVTAKYKTEVMVTDKSVKWRVGKSSNKCPLVAGFTIGKAKEVRSSSFIVASKPHHLRKKRKRKAKEVAAKEVVKEEEEGIPPRILNLLNIMHQRIMQLQERVRDLEEQRQFDDIATFTFEEFPSEVNLDLGRM